MAGAGPAVDPQGNVYLLDGNGTFDTTLTGAGFPSQGNFGNAFLKISTSSGLAVADYFATFDTVAATAADRDLGSGGTLVLPDFVDGTGQTRHLAVGAGKTATSTWSIATRWESGMHRRTRATRTSAARWEVRSSRCPRKLQ